MTDEHTFEIDALDPDLLETPIAAGRTAEVFDSGNGWVVKLFSFGIPKETAFRELDALKTAALHGLPVPQPGDLVLMKMRWGYAMEKVDGVNGMQKLHAGQDPEEAGRLYAKLQYDLTRQTGKFLPDSHSVSERRIKELTKAPAEARHALLALLKSLPSGSSLLHGDFHPGNVLWRQDGSHVYTDWADAAKGHPSADVARSLVLFGYETKAGSQPPRSSFTSAYLAEWEKMAPGISLQASKWLTICRAVRTLESAEEHADELLELSLRSLP